MKIIIRVCLTATELGGPLVKPGVVNRGPFSMLLTKRVRVN